MMKYEFDDGYCSNDDIVRRKRRSTCISPWFILVHIFSGGKSRNRWCKKKKLDNGFGRSGVANGITNVCVSSSSDTQKEDSIKLGVGLGLLYLAVANRNEEINKKVVELDQKMELLFQNYNAESENHRNNSSSSSSNCCRGDNHSLRMDELEAEITAEFDRFQIQTDTDNSSSNQNYSEVNSAPEESHEEEIVEQNYSVSASELKRRLHQVLEERQKERIDELESALEFAMHELQQKERQLSWWKWKQTNFFIKEDKTRILSLTYQKTLV